jgi:hypothetical protein
MLTNSQKSSVEYGAGGQASSQCSFIDTSIAYRTRTDDCCVDSLKRNVLIRMRLLACTIIFSKTHRRVRQSAFVPKTGSSYHNTLVRRRFISHHGTLEKYLASAGTSTGPGIHRFDEPGMHKRRFKKQTGGGTSSSEQKQDSAKGPNGWIKTVDESNARENNHPRTTSGRL